MSIAKRSGRKLWSQHIRRFCDIWLCASKRSPKTIRAYRADLRQFVRNVRTSITPQQVTRPSIEAWVAELQKQDFAPSSIRRKLASLRAFFGYMVGQREMRSSPLNEIRIRFGAVTRLTRVIPRADVRAVIRAADRQASRYKSRRLSAIQRFVRLRDAVIVRLLGATGIRVGELVSIRFADLRLADRTIVIHGKGARDRLAFIADSATMCTMQRYVKELERQFGGDGALFLKASGARLCEDGVRLILLRLGNAASASCRITPHMMRHTAATSLLENGADLRIVQEFLGHNSIRSTERYTHVTQTHLFRVLRRANPLKYVA